MGNVNGKTEGELTSLCELYLENDEQLPLTLTASDLKLAKRVWTSVTATDRDVGVQIFKLILSKSAAVRRLFGVSDEDFDRIDVSGRYVSHARLVKNVLDLFIRDLDSAADSARIRANLRSLGARHVTFRKEGFQPDYWIDFASSIIEVTRCWPVPRWHRSRFDNVWRQLICFLIANMRLGYQQELLKISNPVR